MCVCVCVYRWAGVCIPGQPQLWGDPVQSAGLHAGSVYAVRPWCHLVHRHSGGHTLCQAQSPLWSSSATRCKTTIVQTTLIYSVSQVFSNSKDHISILRCSCSCILKISDIFILYILSSKVVSCVRTLCWCHVWGHCVGVCVRTLCWFLHEDTGWKEYLFY